MHIPDIRIETERLVLRLPQPEDYDASAAMMADEETALVEKASGAWIGQAGPWMPEGWPGTEVGWALRREFTGKGYALEAATAAIDWAFDALGWTEVIHSIQLPNKASIALAERLGSAYRGTERLPPPYENVEVGVWAQSREQWMAARRQREALA